MVAKIFSESLSISNTISSPYLFGRSTHSTVFLKKPCGKGDIADMPYMLKNN
jgi:hypothetical protein